MDLFERQSIPKNKLTSEAALGRTIKRKWIAKNCREMRRELHERGEGVYHLLGPPYLRTLNRVLHELVAIVMDEDGKMQGLALSRPLPSFPVLFSTQTRTILGGGELDRDAISDKGPAKGEEDRSLLWNGIHMAVGTRDIEKASLCAFALMGGKEVLDAFDRFATFKNQGGSGLLYVACMVTEQVTCGSIGLIAMPPNLGLQLNEGMPSPSEALH